LCLGVEYHSREAFQALAVLLAAWAEVPCTPSVGQDVSLVVDDHIQEQVGSLVAACLLVVAEPVQVLVAHIPAVEVVRSPARWGHIQTQLPVMGEAHTQEAVLHSLVVVHSLEEVGHNLELGPHSLRGVHHSLQVAQGIPAVVLGSLVGGHTLGGQRSLRAGHSLVLVVDHSFVHHSLEEVGHHNLVAAHSRHHQVLAAALNHLRPSHSVHLDHAVTPCDVEQGSLSTSCGFCHALAGGPCYGFGCFVYGLDCGCDCGRGSGYEPLTAASVAAEARAAPEDKDRGWELDHAGTLRMGHP